MGAAFVGFNNVAAPVYANVQANSSFLMATGPSPNVENEADGALPGWRLSAVRNGDHVWMVWATAGLGLRWVRIDNSDDDAQPRLRIFGEVHTRAGAYVSPVVTLTAGGPVVYYGDGGVGGDVRIAFLRDHDGAYLGDALLGELGWNIVGDGSDAAWVNGNNTRYVDTGCH